MCEMDTNSSYIAIAGDSVESLVKPELRVEFDQDKCNWFPRTDTPEHKAYDNRTPGLFKMFSGRDKELSGSVPRLITVLALKISSVLKG